MSNKKKVLFIVNPISGGTKKESAVYAIRTCMDSDRYDWEIVYTAGSGDGASFASQAVADGYDIVTAVGGDGTVSEIASQLLHSNTALGIIPCGSGNGLARHLHIPLEYTKAVEHINRSETKLIDYGKINGLPFFCTCGMGFDAYVSARFDNSAKRGPIGYVENAFKEIHSYKPENYILTDDKGESRTYRGFCITCANASQYGNNAYIAPKASLEDGLIDVTVVEPFNITEVPLLAVQFLNGKLPNKGNIKMFQTRKLHVKRENEGYLHRDGDPFWGGTDIFIEAIPQGLKAVVNGQAEIRPISLIQAMSMVFKNKLYSNTVLGQTIAQSGRDIIEKLGL